MAHGLKSFGKDYDKQWRNILLCPSKLCRIELCELLTRNALILLWSHVKNS